MLATRSTPGLASWLMNSTAVPRVYERWWRPAWGFLATAGRHTSMEREYTNATEALRIRPGATVQTVAATRTRQSAGVSGGDHA